MSFSQWIANFFNSNDGDSRKNVCKSAATRKPSKFIKKAGSLIKLPAAGAVVEQKPTRKHVTFNLIPTVHDAGDWDRSLCYLQDPYHVDTRPRRIEAGDLC